MNPAAPDGAPPRRISVYMHICKHRTAPPCLGEALRRGTLIKLQGLMIFMVRVCTPVNVRFNRAEFFIRFLTGKMKPESSSGLLKYTIHPDFHLPLLETTVTFLCT